MTDIYSDLENYNDVNIVNELKIENAELKTKLGECVSYTESLQKDFDQLSAEYKTLERNYSSLLGIARAEIKRKTDMITNLNIEKDMLVINQFKNAPGKRHQMMNFNNVNSERRNNDRHKPGQKQGNEFTRKECGRLPSESSSTTTEIPSKLSSSEAKQLDIAKGALRSVHKKNEVNRNEMSPDLRQDHRDERPQMQSVERRLTAFASYPKLSSDEEFEDMYSALEPVSLPKGSFLRDESERGRKRVRDDPQHSRRYQDTFDSHERHPKHAEAHRDRYSTQIDNRNRYYESDKNVNRDKYDPLHSHRNKYSPDRHRRGKREYLDDRYMRPYDRHRRLESPTRDTYRNQNQSRELRPYTDRERSNSKSDIHRYSQTTHPVQHKIHGEYDEPQVKRVRMDEIPNLDEERRHSDRRYSTEHRLIERTDHTSCQSPDYLYAEHVPSNAPVKEIRGTPVTSLDDPRLTSTRYIKQTDNTGNKDTYTASSCNINLKPVLWGSEKNEAPSALLCQPSQVSDELVKEIYMDIDEPLSNIAAESGDFDDVTDYQDKDMGLNEQHSAEKTNPQNTENDSIHTEENVNEKDAAEKSTVYRIPKLTKANKQHSAEKLPTISTLKSDDFDTNRGNSIEPVRNELPDIKNNTNAEENKILMSKSANTNNHKRIPDNYEVPNNHKDQPETEQVRREFKHQVLSVRHIVEGDLELSDEPNDAIEIQHKGEKLSTKKKHKGRKSSKERKSDLEINNRKTKSKKDKEKEVKDKEKEVKHKEKEDKDKETEVRDKEKEVKHKEKEVKDKDEEVKPKNKFSELFGDSSSLITPEDLELATTQVHSTQVHTHPTDTYELVCENAQDGTNLKEKQNEALTLLSRKETVKPNESQILNNNPTAPEALTPVDINQSKPIKDTKIRSLSKDKKTDNAADESVKDAKDVCVSNDETPVTVDNIKSSLKPAVEKSSSSEKSKEILHINNPTKKIKDSLKSTEKHKETSKPDKKIRDTLKKTENYKETSKPPKKLKSNDEKSPQISNQSTKKANINRNDSIAESIKPFEISNSVDNKENTTYINNSKQAISSDMPNIFEDTLVPNKNENVDKNTTVEKPLENGKPKEIGATGIVEIPNLVPPTEDSGLVKTIVISTGIQPSHTNLLHLDPKYSQYEPLKALATSTPAKELSVPNTLSEIEPNTNQSTNCGKMKVVSENTAPQYDSDVPDVRINVHRRRKKKRVLNS